MGQMTPERTRRRSLFSFYLTAKERVIEEGYWPEICIDLGMVTHTDLTPSSFLREYAWVVLSAGLSERVVRARFPAVAEAFEWWTDPGFILRRSSACRRAALKAFGNQRKIDAILLTTQHVDGGRFRALKGALLEGRLDPLAELPFMGPATTRHLAKNLGANVAKPDRHLKRIALAAGFAETDDLCETLSACSGDTHAVVDSVLWRFAVLERGYLGIMWHLGASVARPKDQEGVPA